MKTSKYEKSKDEFTKGSQKKGPYRKDTKQSGVDVSKGSGKRSCSKRDNDPSWYTAYPGIYSATANISFNQPVGIPADLTDTSGSAAATTGSQVIVPNVMSIGIAFTPGISGEAASIANTAMFQNYNFVRHANSGSKNYDAVDLQMYYIAVSEALAYLWHGIRAFGTLASFSALNRSIPKSLFKAYGLDYETWAANPAQIRAKLNLAASKMASLCIPMNARLFARMQYLMQNVFMDGDSIKSQMYVFIPEVVHEWGRVSNVGQLTAKNYLNVNTPTTADAYFASLDSLLAPLLEDEDINVMSGDVMKAYGASGLLTIPVVPELYATPIITSKENPFMMSQIENMSWTILNLESLDIKQSTSGHIIFEPHWLHVPYTNVNHALTTVKALLNSRNVEVTNDEIMELTRLVPVFDSQMQDAAENTANITVRSCGSELPLSVYIITQGVGSLSATSLAKIYASQADIPSEYFMFDWAPIVYTGVSALIGDKLTARVQAVYGDLSNYTAISKNTVSLINDTAIASELLIDAPKQ